MNYTWRVTTESSNGAVQNLGKQVERVLRGARQGSFQSRYRYAKAVERFTVFLAMSFRLQKIQNTTDKHLEAYVVLLKAKGCTDKFIKTELSGIRWFCRQIPGQGRVPQLESGLEAIEANRRFGLGSTPEVGPDRSWSDQEFAAMTEAALSNGEHAIEKALRAVWFFGLRLNEMATMRRSALEAALRTGILHVRGKNGRHREIPLAALSPRKREAARAFLEAAVRGVHRGGYVFVPEGLRVHEFKQEVQRFIGSHREGIQESPREARLTYHGLRHTWANEEYTWRRENGQEKGPATAAVAELLGHGRDTVTAIYVPALAQSVRERRLAPEH